MIKNLAAFFEPRLCLQAHQRPALPAQMRSSPIPLVPPPPGSGTSSAHAHARRGVPHQHVVPPTAVYITSHSVGRGGDGGRASCLSRARSRTLHAASSAPCWHTGWTALRCAIPYEKALWPATRLVSKKFDLSLFLHLEHLHEDFWRISAVSSMSGGTTSPPPRTQSICFSRFSSLSSISTRRAESSIDVVFACFGFFRVNTTVFSNMRGLTSVEPQAAFVPVWLALFPALTHLRLGSSAYCVWQAFS
ncbi:hypothetical protein B0H14DRAFT_3458212 [Mycena olivaceomarginata]|nr:hypothetical protein B0H14DRAFT_3458212 [Mycena olivaceomarginata]